MPQHSQRLHQLVDLGRLEAGLAERVINAEEAIYADPENHLVNWDAQDVQALFEAAGFAAIHLQTETSHALRRITPQQLGHWFNPGGQKHHTYASYLHQQLDDEEVRQVRKLFERELTHKTVNWSSTQVFLQASCG